MKLIQRGSKGEDVRKWQTFLSFNGYMTNDDIDGIFGGATYNATIKFQEDNGLVVDGIVGKLSIQKAQTFGFFKEQTTFTREVNEIIVHITASNDNATIADIKAGHLARGFSDIGYHFIVDRAGIVHNGRDVDVIGAHTAGYNVGTIGISYIARGADNDQRGEYGKYMTEAQRIALEKKIAELLVVYGLKPTDVSGHNQYNLGKACPCFWIPKSPEFIDNIVSHIH